MKLRSIRSVAVKGKRVLVRAELNVARDTRGRIVDDSRLRAVLPTFDLLRKRGARTIIATHLGRPEGRRVSSLSTRTLLRPLSRALRAKVAFAPDSIGPAVKRAAEALHNGDVLLLENVRFHAGEEKDDQSYAYQLSSLADLFVLECFGAAHRKHASVVGVGRYLPSFAGLRFVEEVNALSSLLTRPRRPLVAVLGGAKISTKAGLISRLLTHVDALLLGGALANTILKAQGLHIGTSYNEPEMVRAVRMFRLTDVRFHIPVDVVVARPGAAPAVRAVGAVRPRESILDIGPDTIALYAGIIRRAKSVVWNGPMGMFERKPFDRGTREIARSVAGTKGYSVIGGGETVEAVNRMHLARRINFISTGGGAMMEFLEGKHLPGVELVREYR